jgi:phage/plasmid-associated DNA primase
LKDKLLLLISELPSYLGTEPMILKNIIGGDVLPIEEKYKNPTQIISNVFLIITSNTLWNLKLYYRDDEKIYLYTFLK